MMTTNEKKMAIKPESLYIRQNLKAKDVKEGDIIPVTVTGYDCERKIICCEISSHLRKAFIRVENFMFPKLGDFDADHIPATIYTHIGKTIVAKVITKGCSGNIELDRRVVMENTINHFADKLGTIVAATINAIRTYGAFIDIGNGVEVMIHVSELSTALGYSNLDTAFKIGEQIEVRLLNFDPNTSRFLVSRPEAYEREILPCGSIQVVRILRQTKEDAAIVEYNPNTTGIMYNMPKKKAKHGRYAMCLIKKNTQKGFKAKFVSWYED